MGPINEVLYNALEEVFGEVRTTNEGEQAEYAYQTSKLSCFKTKQKTYATVNKRGEQYAVCCPVCGDERYRLYFSHLWGSKVIPKKRKKPVYFGYKLCFCQNEQCHRKEVFKKYTDKLIHALKNSNIEIDAVLQKAAEVKFTDFLDKASGYPKGCIPLVAEDVPGAVVSFLEKRNFDMPELHEKYLVKYAPAGLIYSSGEKERKFYEDRVLIPIIQRRILVSWQARTVMDFKGNKHKYIFPDNCTKNQFLYNMDKALQHTDICICEGVTDVWRIGDDAISIFGKTISKEQIRIMKNLWGYKGSCVVALDEDDPDAIHKANRIATLLRLQKVFPKGVAVLELQDRDPADFEKDEIRGLIENARSTCCN